MKDNYPITLLLLILSFVTGCNQHQPNQFTTSIPHNVINYVKHKDSKGKKLAFAFSDQGAWFGYGLPGSIETKMGFTGPYLMTQENGTWCSEALSYLELKNEDGDIIDLKNSSKSYNSHLEINWQNDHFEIRQYLFFVNKFTAITATLLINKSSHTISLNAQLKGNINNKSLHFEQKDSEIIIHSDKSDATGFIAVENEIRAQTITDSSYISELNQITLKPNQSKEIIWSQSFVFEQDIKYIDTKNVDKQMQDWQNLLHANINKKEIEFIKVKSKLKEEFKDSAYDILLAKALLTLQNNYRVPAGELKHAGVFPSYHYEWFHGFWAWDSWKHAVALAQYDTEKAKDQIRAMIDYIEPNGFIPDCIYRDTTIEKHNYRNSKPPLLSWAVWEIYKIDADKYFLDEMLPSLLLQHSWWYKNRDHDNDNICEYGSTDGTLISAKWESGMDNAVRFDHSTLLKNSKTTYSLDQESVDLNAFLYADKIYLTEILKELGQLELGMRFQLEAKILKQKIQTQFFDSVTGWFYDTEISGKSFIKTKGCEGWIPLWANVATTNQTEKIAEKMMDTAYFFKHVPFQTLSASNSKFKPFRGYWRGPIWVDQAYFGIKGLQNYSFNKEAHKATLQMLHNAEGLLEKGPAIRENYNPITGEGMEAHNFSWSAAHFMLMILDLGY